MRAKSSVSEVTSSEQECFRQRPPSPVKNPKGMIKAFPYRSGRWSYNSIKKAISIHSGKKVLAEREKKRAWWKEPEELL